MSPEDRAALLEALEANERAGALLRAALARAAAPKPPERPLHLVPLATACRVWGVSKDTARKRALRGAGEKYLGRWFIRSAAIGATYDD